MYSFLFIIVTLFERVRKSWANLAFKYKVRLPIMSAFTLIAIVLPRNYQWLGVAAAICLAVMLCEYLYQVFKDIKKG